MDDHEIIELVKKNQGVESDYAVAKILDMTVSNLSRIRTRKGKLSHKTLMKIGKILDVNPNDLVELEQQELVCKEGFNKGGEGSVG